MNDYLNHSVSREIRLLKGSLAAITMVLLMGGAFFGVMPIAIAEDDDGENDEHHHDTDKKCKKKRYGDQCDKGKPEINITDPTRREKITDSELVVTIDATDAISGIKTVEIRFNGGPIIPVTTKLDSDTWQYTTDCDDNTKQNIRVAVRATDWVGNKARDHVNIVLMCIAP